MRAVVCHHHELEVTDLPDPEPAEGQVLIRVLRAGICGSDLHARVHADATAEIASEVGYEHFMRSDVPVVLGHEFVGEVVAYGPGTRRRWEPGTRVVSLPLLRQPGGLHMTGLSPEASGAYAELVAVSEAVTFEVPASAHDEHAALTEPLAVAWHAVRKGDVKDTAVVVGCGPIGLAVILMLKASGVRTVVASDLSAGRRALAARCGADVVVDPTTESPWDRFADDERYLTTAEDFMNLGMSTMEKLRAVPFLPWSRVFQAAEKLGAVPRGPVVFECVGVPGILEQIISEAPLMTRFVVVGVCMEPDTFRPAMAINKEAELRFAFCYDPAEFHTVLQMVAKGRVDPSPLVTDTVGLAGVADAFEQLADPERHAKILIDPSL
ncbi:zinc-binding dehydrogenase [Aeromicrobium sp. CTD01-1L150]|uniref:zinc-binding dehydrogenase n=2 Tax=Aeromicrobium sp. CTD01-1L150 TaxID=3341830 RepID=UPI0035BF5BCB